MQQKNDNEIHPSISADNRGFKVSLSDFGGFFSFVDSSHRIFIDVILAIKINMTSSLCLGALKWNNSIVLIAPQFPLRALIY